MKEKLCGWNLSSNLPLTSKSFSFLCGPYSQTRFPRLPCVLTSALPHQSQESICYQSRETCVNLSHGVVMSLRGIYNFGFICSSGINAFVSCKRRFRRWQNSSWAIPNPERWCCESAALNMPANLENSAVATGLEKVTFHSNPKERQRQRMLKLPHNCTHLTC